MRFPDLKICLSEGGIGWVAGLLDRLEHVRKYDAMYGTWNDVALSPADTFRRNFWVCAIDDPSAFLQRDVIGIGNILVESDYPHADSTWPHTQERLAAQLAGLSDAEVARVTWANASELFRHPVPDAVQRDPECLLTSPSTRRAGRSSAVATVRSAALRRRALRARPTGGGCPSRHRGREPLDATAPGAAPPQTVGGLDLVPGHDPGVAVGSLPHRRDLHARPRRLASGAGVGAGRELPHRRRVAAPRTTARGSRPHDVVVVGLNYRLGALGWLAADGRAVEPRRCATCGPRSSGCAPTSAAFGGDPDRIVLMGESAGSGHRHRATLAVGHGPATSRSRARSCRAVRPRARSTPPPRRGSGSSSSTPRVRRASTTCATLRSTSLLAAQEQTVEAALAKVGMMPFHPWVDDDLLTAPAHRAALPAIPLVVGTTAHEMELFRDQVPQLPDDIAVSFLAGKAVNLGITDEAAGARRVRGVRRRSRRSGRRPRAAPAERAPGARVTKRAATRVFRYRFTWEAPVRRACHALDLPFTFGTLDVSTWREFAGADGARAGTADALSARMQQAWTSLRRRRCAVRRPRRTVAGGRLVELGPDGGRG